MKSPIHVGLASVRRRQHLVRVVKFALMGLVISSLAATAVAAARWFLGQPLNTGILAAVLATGPVIGAAVGLLLATSWKRAATAVDSHYGLKDRATTALAFVNHPQRTALHELQLDDTAHKLRQVEPQRVVPLQLHRMGLCAVSTLAVAMGFIALMAWLPIGSDASDLAMATTVPAIVEEAKKLSDSLQEFEEITKEDKDPELEKLVKELRQKVEEMQEPGVDVKEALAKLSEMQAAVVAQQAQFNNGLVDGQMQAIGEALSAAQPLDGAGKAFQEAKYDKAAEELEKLDDPELDKKEAKAVEEKLKEIAKSAGDVGLGQISEAAADLAEGARGNKGKFQKGVKTLAKAAKTQARRRKINNLLDAQLARLNEGKCNCECNGGPEGKQPQKSLQASTSWGRSTSGNVQGEKTSLLAERKMEQITGNPGDEGDSEIETTSSAEGRQSAGRKYKDVYKDYKRMSEAVLDSEPIPLGHRQTIRKYFELIRPQNEDAESKGTKSSS